MTNERVFVSYRRLDQPNDVTRLIGKLERKLGSVTFVDAHSVEYGDDFADRISKALSDCEILLAVIGPRWEEILRERRKDEPDFVLIEIGGALERGIPVVPVLLNRINMPSRSDLPPDLQNLAGRQALVLKRRWFGYDGLKELSWAISSRFLEAKYSGQDRIAALKNQKIITDCVNNDDISRTLAARSTLRTLDTGATLYPIDSHGSRCLYFGLSGSFSLRAGGWWHNYHLEPNEIVGEFPILLKSQARYVAGVKAREPSVVARVSDRDFEEIAGANPDLWRAMSKMLVERLMDSNRQRRKVELWATITTAVLSLALVALVVHLSMGMRG